MTQPTSVFLGPDGPMFDRGKNKVYLRTLLYSTARRGHVLESLHLSLQRNETTQNFNIWVYGEKGDLGRTSTQQFSPLRSFSDAARLISESLRVAYAARVQK